MICTRGPFCYSSGMIKQKRQLELFEKFCCRVLDFDSAGLDSARLDIIS